MSAVFPLNTAVLYFSPRLHQALEGIFSRPLTLIEAPMGYGKTVAARDVLGKREIRLVWTSVLGNSEDAFWRDFCRALRRSFPQAQDTLESLLRLGYPRDAVRLDAARELLLQLDFTSGPETVLAADDIHLLPPSGGHGLAGLCALLARQGVEHLRMVLISRDVWRGEREILKLKGRLGVVGREAFALNEEEIRAYYALCGLRLSPEEARALHAATEGWISALYLYLLHYSEDGALSRPTAMNALVEKEIFSRLTEDAKDLLLRLAPLERFSAPQASFLRGTDATALLAELRARNAFINYDEADESYALHSIFRQYLQERFDGLPEERRRAIHRGCADWFVGREEACPAVDAFYAAGDDESALAVLESEISRNLVHEESRFFIPCSSAARTTCWRGTWARPSSTPSPCSWAGTSRPSARAWPGSARNARPCRKTTRKPTPGAASWNFCSLWPPTTTLRPCPRTTAGPTPCWAGPPACSGRNRPGPWAAPRCSSCSTANPANWRRRSA